MSDRNRWNTIFWCGIAWCACAAGNLQAEGAIATRVFYQDDSGPDLKWTDLSVGNELSLSSVRLVSGFPKLDPKRQTLVQMESSRGFIMVGVRDDDDGKFQSGWVLIESGVVEEEHGNHSHWYYSHEPRVRAVRLDDKQGNPAHLYQYQGAFYLANDKLNGFTRLDPGSITPTDTSASILAKSAFHRGGGGHITMAAFENTVGYSSWIDRDGPNQGRVDITLLSSQGNSQEPQFINLPHAGIHGATTVMDKVFFAPSDGICWFTSPRGSNVSPSAIKVEHLSLGKIGDKPVRTGGFTTYENHVAFTTGSGSDSAVWSIDASRQKVQAVQLKLPMNKANRPAGFEIVKRRIGLPLGFVFHDHPADVDAPNRLSILDLDPNADDSWSDAKEVLVLAIGKAKSVGHGGHHSMSFDADRKRAVFSCPGDETLNFLSVNDWKETSAFTVGGTPSKVIAIGGRGGGH